MSFAGYTPHRLAIPMEPTPAGGGIFRDGSGSYRYIDGEKVRVADQRMPEAGPRPREMPQLRSNGKPVRCDDGKMYPSLTAAGESVGGSGSSLKYAIKNGTPYRGHRWRYATPREYEAEMRRRMG